jgi:hypothetical protein
MVMLLLHIGVRDRKTGATVMRQMAQLDDSNMTGRLNCQDCEEVRNFLQGLELYR